jgi:hypothetical protein
MSEEDLRDLIEQAHQIRELTKHPGWAVYTDWLIHRMRGEQEALLRGNISDIQDYKLKAGTVRGVSMALSAADDTQMLVDNERARRRDEE